MSLVSDRVPPSAALDPGTRPRRRAGWLAAVTGVVVLGLVVTLVVANGREEPWRSVLHEDFDSPVEVGAFPSATYEDRWEPYPDGWGDTSGVGTYAPSRTLSVADGSLQIAVGKDGDEYLGAAVVALPTYGQVYGRFAVRWRADPAAGYGLAFLLWPDSNSWPDDGEIDFPEGDLDGTVTATAHHADPSGSKEQFGTDALLSDWHTTVVEWTPTAVTFVLDGEVIGRSTTGIPNEPMHWVMQVGTNGRDTPPATSSGVVQVDWVHIDAYEL
ncbi:glycosyl hydrolase family 16 [Geodermatophilus normandii]|uniref:Glycosyl hydrolase family 16 n=1 Tax=Geodermatophilus normandii TaxID=1137989 RepID=A0A317QGB0_9ACTN|nr:glycoside hydrolase family 16 protein [Geodermatophilus normandii]PWW21804.1 glycosyl hydrolase family 16 [Geodermatophilus normandii]